MATAAETKAVNPEQHGDDYDHQPRGTAPYPHQRCLRLAGRRRTKVYELINQHELVQVSIGRRSFVTTESLRGYVGRLAEEATSALLEEEAAADEAVLAAEQEKAAV
jgi:hypothetical protein